MSETRNSGLTSLTAWKMLAMAMEQEVKASTLQSSAFSRGRPLW